MKRQVLALTIIVPVFLSSAVEKGASQKGKQCDPSYPTVCIPPPPPDLDCKDIPYRNFRAKDNIGHYEVLVYNNYREGVKNGRI